VDARDHDPSPLAASLFAAGWRRLSLAERGEQIMRQDAISRSRCLRDNAIWKSPCFCENAT
jgi:hypothetical protein